MEKLQGAINPRFFAEHLDVECADHGFGSAETLALEEEESRFSLPALDDKMPFLQMLQSVESPPFSSFQEPNFQTLLRLQHLKKQPCDAETQNQVLELESCITQLHSPVKSETKELPHHLPVSTCCVEGLSLDRDRKAENPALQQTQLCRTPPTVTRERRKRKRTRPPKNKEEVESQRMTHIAVERNRRRQMNDHLNALRSLMPTSYIQRGDQASIIGGAIDFVKELEQLLQSLEARRRMRKGEEGSESCSPSCVVEGSSSTAGEESAAEVVVTVIQNHVNLKIRCPRSAGQLLKAIVALEDLRLTVLHLNITSSQATVHYCFNLKIEEDCKLGSADEIAGAVHQIFRFINGS